MSTIEQMLLAFVIGMSTPFILAILYIAIYGKKTEID